MTLTIERWFLQHVCSNLRYNRAEPIERPLSKEDNDSIIRHEKGISLGGLCVVRLVERAEQTAFSGVKYQSRAGVAKW